MLSEPSLRAIPDLTVLRPADANETIEAYRYAMVSTDRPSVMVLSRQKLPVLIGTKDKAREGVQRGAYILAEPSEGRILDGILIASGVRLAMKARDVLNERGIGVRVVSMPSWDLFEKQSEDYQEMVLPVSVKRKIAIEMASPIGWERYVGDKRAIIGVSAFGASAPGEIIMERYGFTVDHVVRTFQTRLD
jgi:transketolase